jgi:pSer/pThr/pTyr-binding forkhead associated (FHA) protein
MAALVAGGRWYRARLTGFSDLELDEVVMSSYYLIRGEDPAGADRVEVEAEMLVGRGEDCDLRVQDGHPSRRHARLSVEGGELWLEDLGSANGTTVNGRAITSRTRLQHGDRIGFDLSAFVVAAPDGNADADATVVRRIDADPEATVVRPAPAAQPPAAGPGAEPPPAAGSVPRSWADPDFQPEGTRVLTPEELKAMAAGAPAAAGGPMVSGQHLRVRSGNSAGSVLVMSGTGEWTIGADAGRDLRLDDPGISGFHAKLSHEGGRWRIIDQMSANGTYVNGDKATVSYLKHGDRIRIAQVECELDLGESKTARKRPAASPASSRNPWLIIGIAAAATLIVLAAASWLL